MPEIEPAELATLRTLRDVADKLSAAGVAASTEVAAAAAPAASVQAPTTEPTVAAALPGTGGVDVTALALEVVSEKTGYPVDMLDLDMEMEAGLGIDSIKQVEILSELQERLPGMPEIRSCRSSRSVCPACRRSSLRSSRRYGRCVMWRTSCRPPVPLLSRRRRLRPRLQLMPWPCRPRRLSRQLPRRRPEQVVLVTWT
jgi:hypothetical protein